MYFHEAHATGKRYREGRNGEWIRLDLKRDMLNIPAALTNDWEVESDRIKIDISREEFDRYWERLQLQPDLINAFAKYLGFQEKEDK